MRDPSGLLPNTPFIVDELLSPAEALERFRARVTLAPLGLEHVALDDALGRVLGSHVASGSDLPPCARSTMDGFAIAVDGGAAPRRIVGEIAMGQPAPRGIGRDEALRIPTGGVLPDGADAVVPIEDVAEDGRTLKILTMPPRGGSITPAASDLRAGERVLERGRRIGGPELGVLATLGYERVSVVRRPCLVVLSTGDELVPAALTPRVGQVRDSNRHAVAGALRALGCAVTHGPIVRDDADSLRTALREALAAGDGAVLTGGSSVGARDFVPRIVATLGDPGVVVHGLRVKPGKPTLLAAVDGKPIFGLPGNPTSASMMLEAAVRPLLAEWIGERGMPASLRATAGAAFIGRVGWTWYVPVRVEPTAPSADGLRFRAVPMALHSAHVSALARAVGYVVVDTPDARIEPGAPVDVMRFAAGGAPP